MTILSSRCCLKLRFLSSVKDFRGFLFGLRRDIFRDLSSYRVEKVVFIGSDSFSIPSLSTLVALFGLNNVCAVTSNENNVVGKYCRKNNIRIIPWKQYKSEDIDLQADIGVVSSFGFMIPSYVINRFPLGMLNVHASLLPRWRGASPIFHCLQAGDNETGISIMKIAPHRFDVGPVLFQKSIPVHPHIRAPELTHLMSNLGAECLKVVFSDLDIYFSNSIQQNDSEATYAPKILPERCHINWEKSSSFQIYNLHRGLFGIYKLRSFLLDLPVDLDEFRLIKKHTNTDNNKCIRYKKSEHPTIRMNPSPKTDFSDMYNCHPICLTTEMPSDNSIPPGAVHFMENVVCVKCSPPSQSSEIANSDCHSDWIGILKFKIKSKWINANDFKNGYMSKIVSKNQYSLRFESHVCHDIEKQEEVCTNFRTRSS